MRFLLITLLHFLLFAALNHGFCQEIIASTSGKKFDPFNVRSFSSRDSVLITFEDRKDLSKNIQTFFYITKSGASEIFKLKKGEKTAFCGFESTGNETYNYFIRKTKVKGVTLAAWVLTKTGKEPVLLEGNDIIINNDIVAIVNDSDGLLILSRDVSGKILKILRVNRLKITTEIEYELPDRYSFINTSEIRVVGEAIGWIDEANTSAKIYLKRSHLVFTWDHQSGTDILYLNTKSKDQKLLTIPEPTDPNCNSFLLDSALVRLSVFDKYFTIKSYSVSNGSLISKLTVDQNQNWDETGGSTPNSNYISNKEKFKTLIRTAKFGGAPFIIINSEQQAQQIITVGSYKTNNLIPNHGVYTPAIALVEYVGGKLDQQFEIKELEHPTVQQYLNFSRSEDSTKLKSGSKLLFKKVSNLMSQRGYSFLSAVLKQASEIYVLARNVKSEELVIFRISE